MSASIGKSKMKYFITTNATPSLNKAMAQLADLLLPNGMQIVDVSDETNLSDKDLQFDDASLVIENHFDISELRHANLAKLGNFPVTTNVKVGPRRNIRLGELLLVEPKGTEMNDQKQLNEIFHDVGNELLEILNGDGPLRVKVHHIKSKIYRLRNEISAINSLSWIRSEITDLLEFLNQSNFDARFESTLKERLLQFKNFDFDNSTFKSHEEARVDNRNKATPFTVLIVEDEEKAAYQLKRRLDHFFTDVGELAVNVELFTPQPNENQSDFQTRFEDSLQSERCDNLYHRLLAVVFDEDFSSIPLLDSTSPLTGATLAQSLKEKRPNLTTILLSGANVFKLIGEHHADFDSVFSKWNDAHLEELSRFILTDFRRKFATPFWSALQDFSSKPVETFHAMALAHGRSVKQGTTLDDVFSFYGENYFLAETSATAGGLDSLLNPKSTLKAAQEKAANAFGAIKTLFVTNGTSTANKIVLQSILQPGDTVMLDRNCHVSHHYSVAMLRACPAYLEPYHLNEYGISGGIPLDTVGKTLNNLLDAGIVPKAIMLTNCTFDGVTCDPKSIIRSVYSTLVDREQTELLKDIVFFFDEAWFAFARFHSWLIDRTAMSSAAKLVDEEEFFRQNLRVYATQSTHKTLSGFRQSSMIHVWDPLLFDKGIQDQRLKFSYLSHTTTSPHSGILASLDFARRQVDLEGFDLVHNAIDLANRFRQDFLNADPGGMLRKKFEVLSQEQLVPEKYKGEFVLDPTKITVRLPDELTGTALKKDLLNRYHLQINKFSDRTILMMTNIGSTVSGVSQMKRALLDLSRHLSHRPESSIEKRQALEIPVFSGFWQGEINGTKPGVNRDVGFFANNLGRANTKWVKLATVLAGDQEYVSANFVAPYPPGYPILVPGQLIDNSTASFLSNLNNDEIHGMKNEGGRQVRVLEVG